MGLFTLSQVSAPIFGTWPQHCRLVTSPHVLQVSVSGIHVSLSYCVIFIAHTSFTNVAAECVRPAGCKSAPMQITNSLGCFTIG